MIRDLEVIHITKRKIVEEISNLVAASDIVNRMYVFGSSVKDTCSDESDIDICIDTNCSDNDMRLYDLYCKISKACDYNCDILTYHKLGITLQNEINKNGIIVYEIENEKC